MICPSMLSADFTALGDDLRAVESAGADCIHWDIMDGRFVDVITFGAHVIAAHRRLSSLRFDVHLMVENPEKHIMSFVEAGADAIIVHPESTAHLHKVLTQIKNFGKSAGVALNPATSVDCLKYCADLIDIVLVMSVNPGSSGQKFILSQLRKIEQLRREFPKTAEICVDGGINAETASLCVQNGADSLVTGSYLFKSQDYAVAIQNLKNCKKNQ